MNFDISNLIAGFVFGTLGFSLFMWAKKRSNMHNVVIGIALMVYPYFIDKAWANWVIGFALCYAAYYFRYS